MRTPWIILLSLSFLAIAGPASAQGTNPYDVSWSALDPGNDWAAQVLRSIFPIPGGTPGTSTGNEATVIGQIVGQFTGFVAAIAAAFVAYTTIINIHRAAETSRILGSGQSWMFVVRVGFAGIMMFPLGGGFSAGQALVLQGAMVGVGMAKALYANAVQAVGPDALVIAQPMVPGTEQIVSALIDSELCMDLVNLASNTATTGSGQLVPAPQPITVKDSRQNRGFYRAHLAVKSRNTPCRQASGIWTWSLKLRGILRLQYPCRDQVAPNISAPRFRANAVMLGTAELRAASGDVAPSSISTARLSVCRTCRDCRRGDLSGEASRFGQSGDRRLDCRHAAERPRVHFQIASDQAPWQ